MRRLSTHFLVSPGCRILALFAVLLSGCSASADSALPQATPSLALQSAFDSLRSDSGTIGRRGGAWLSRIRAARLTSDGRVVVLSGDAPFVRVYAPNGKQLAAFVRRGSGPGEARVPTALAVSSGEVVLVVDGNRLLTFTLNGTYLAETRSEVLPVDATRNPCGTGWLLYGPESGTMRSRAWLTQAEADTQYRRKAVSLLDTLSAPWGGYGKRVLAGSVGAVLMHEAAVPPTAHWYSCGADGRLVETRRIHMRSAGELPAARAVVRNGM